MQERFLMSITSFIHVWAWSCFIAYDIGTAVAVLCRVYRIVFGIHFFYVRRSRCHFFGTKFMIWLIMVIYTHTHTHIYIYIYIYMIPVNGNGMETDLCCDRRSESVVWALSVLSKCWCIYFWEFPFPRLSLLWACFFRIHGAGLLSAAHLRFQCWKAYLLNWKNIFKDLTWTHTIERGGLVPEKSGIKI